MQEQMQDWFSRSTDDVLVDLESSKDGLSSQEGEDRLRRFGSNRLRESNRIPCWKRFFLQFHSALIYVLLVTALVTLLLGHWVDSGVIVGVVVINAIIGLIQESKAEQAIDSLKKMLAPLAIALRDGRKITLEAEKLVPGDIVYLQSGDKVPADLRLAKAKNLHIDEATLTGESVSAHKQEDLLQEAVPLADRTNMAFAGTLVTSGAGIGVVVATADQTEIGQIATMLSDVEGVDTPLIRRLDRFSRVITIAIIVFCFLVFTLGLLAGRPSVEMLMAAVALAVSAIPEGLPAIMTIALAIGVKRMAGRRAVVRKLPAVEALGSVSVICTDKTGTLTRNEMTITQVVTPEGRVDVSGAGYEPTGQLKGDGGVSGDSPLVRELILAGTLCNEARLKSEEGVWRIDGDPTEGALKVLSHKASLDPDGLVRDWPRLDSIPFESEQRYMATLHHDHEGHAMIYLKGSPEKVLSLCKEVDLSYWTEVSDQMAAEGLRVLAIAEKVAAVDQTVLGFDNVTEGFSWLGLVGMIDRPREEAAVAVDRCQAAGIRVKMITGDHLETARAVARQLGIGGEGEALSGLDLDALSDEEFDRAAARSNVFARVSPEHKLRLVQSLQKQREIIAMTGDGANDAPALKQADIGVAMGITGTDVSKEAAEIVLLDDNFASIESAVEEGRTVFDNLKKTILFILPTNGGECLTLVAALLLGLNLPILPLHILWINLVTTVALAITLAFDPVDPDVMNRPPRKIGEPLIDRGLLWRIFYVSVLMAAGTFGLFYYELWAGHSERLARGVAVNAIVFFEVAYVFNTRSLTDSVINRQGFIGNRFVWFGVLAVILIQLLFTYLPVMNSLFQIEPLDAAMWGRVILSSMVLFLLVEGEKTIVRHRNGERKNLDSSG